MTSQKDLGEIAHEDKARKCPDCKSTELEYMHGELICKKCGLVIE